MIFIIVQGLVVVAAIIGVCCKVPIHPRLAWFVIGSYALAHFMMLMDI